MESGAMLGLFSFILLFCPGALIAFTLLDRSVEYSTRLALAIALSPFVVGVEVVALTLMGTSFDDAAIIVLLNAFSLPLLLNQRPIPMPHVGIPSLVAAGCFAMLCAGLIVIWTLVPNFRVYGWHNMMQAAAVYEVTQLPRWPEEMDLAGFSLNYSWFGHVQIAAIVRLTERSALLIFPVVNFAMLFAMFTLLVNTVRLLKPGNLAGAALAVTAGLLTTNVADVVWSYLGGSVWEIRVSTPVHKFLGFDLMTVGLALLTGMICLLVLYARRPTLRIWALVFACAIAIALCYPLLFPAALVLGAATLAVPPVSEVVTGHPFRIRRETVIGAVSLLAAVALFTGYVKLLSAGQIGSMLHLQSRGEALRSASILLMAIGAWLPLLLPAVYYTWRGRHADRLCLLVTAIILFTTYLVITLPFRVQYKFVVAGLLCALPLAAEMGLRFLDRLGRAGMAIAAAVTIAAFIIVAPFVWSRLVPWWGLHASVPLKQSGFQIEPVESAKLQWTIAIRDLTPPETIIVAPPLPLPISIFAERSSYIALDATPARAGYTIPASAFLRTRVYPSDVVAQRRRIVRQCYANDPATDFDEVTRELSSLYRPVALYLPHDNLFLQWLHKQHRGRSIFQDARGTVWLLEAPRS